MRSSNAISVALSARLTPRATLGGLSQRFSTVVHRAQSLRITHAAYTNREERDGLRAIATSLMIALTVVVFGLRHDRRAERSDTNSYIHTSFADVEPAHHDHRCPPIATLI